MQIHLHKNKVKSVSFSVYQGPVGANGMIGDTGRSGPKVSYYSASLQQSPLRSPLRPLLKKGGRWTNQQNNVYDEQNKTMYMMNKTKQLYVVHVSIERRKLLHISVISEYLMIGVFPQGFLGKPGFPGIQGPVGMSVSV